jgi:uncharacterized membrane protein
VEVHFRTAVVGAEPGQLLLQDGTTLPCCTFVWAASVGGERLSSPEQGEMQRYLSIDILRGIAILLMIQVHFVDNLSLRQDPSAWLYDVSVFLGGFAAPFFAFLSGLSYGLWTRKQDSIGRRQEEITKITLRRGLFLFGGGIVFNFFIWWPEEIFNWDILTLIGTSLLFLAFARNLPSTYLTLICLMVLLVSPQLRDVGHYSAYWDDYVYSNEFTFHDVLLGFVANGYFPVFPWIIFPLMGFISGDLSFPRRGPRKYAHWWLCALGIGLLVLSAIGAAIGAQHPCLISQVYANGLTEFPAATDYVLGMLGVLFLSVVLLNQWFDQKEGTTANGPCITILRRYSVFSLTAYVLHHMVILWPLWIYGSWSCPEDPTLYWRRAMPTPMAFALAIAYMVVCYLVLLFLEKHRKYALESLMRWICD